jgi:hypothetical protein
MEGALRDLPSSDRLVAAFKDQLRGQQGNYPVPFSRPVPIQWIHGITTFRAEEVAHQQRKGRRKTPQCPGGAKLYPDSRVLERLAASDAPIMSSVLSSTVTRQVFPQAGQ